FHRSDGQRESQSEAEDVRTDAEHVDAARAVTVDPVGDVVLAGPRLSDLAGHRKPRTRITSVLVAGNWTMFKGPAEPVAFLEAFEPPDGVEAVLCPPFTSLAAAVGRGVPVYAQNVHWSADGAFTGEVSAQMLLELGVEGAIVGHSERRQYFGETGAEREAGETDAVLQRQVAAVPRDDALVIAYEPVWAIGTGKTATPELAQAAHETIKALHDT